MNSSKMNASTWIGLIVGIGGIILGNIIEGGHVNSLVQGAAFVIVFTGTFGAVLVSNRWIDIKAGLKMARELFTGGDANHEQQNLRQILEFARLARKESILAIEPKIKEVEDPFLRDVTRAVVDGIDPQIIRDLFTKQVDIYYDSLQSGAKVWIDAGGFAPTIGIIGAVLGLIHVMGNLTDTSKLGAGIAVAFVATIYGVGSANLIFLPIGNRIKKQIHEKVKSREMVIEGGVAILSGLSPHLIEMKLRSYLDEKPKA